MEQYIQGQSRDLVDQAYSKFVSGLLVIWAVLLIAVMHQMVRSVDNMLTGDNS